MAKVLLINTSVDKIYQGSKVETSVSKYFPVNLLTIAAPLVEKQYEVKLLDLNYQTIELLIPILDDYSPDYVGLTFGTPLYSQAASISEMIKEHSPNIIIIAGGAHISGDYVDTLKQTKIDIAVIGEGDFKLLEIIEIKDKSKILGIAYKDNENNIIVNSPQPFFDDLDPIPFPAIELIDIKDYVIPLSYCRKNPVFPLETSRGCVFGCVYCNKSVFGRNFRTKSITRVIHDLKHISELGFKEVHIIDDGFTTDMLRAKEICKLIISEKIQLVFNCTNGIRADRVDMELLTLMKQAGWYRISVGVESGSQKVLDTIQKGLKLEDIENAFKLCHKVGIETLAFLMFGLPGETEDDIKATIKFAKKLKPHIAKFDIMVPLPSTPIFEEWQKKGHILSMNWDDYHFHSKVPYYKHPSLSLETLNRYLDKSYRDFYLSPSFIFRYGISSLKNGTIINDIKMFLNTKW